MKAKTFLNVIKAHCCEANCGVGKCPMAVQREGYSECMMSVDYDPAKWNVKEIIKVTKKIRGKYEK